MLGRKLQRALGVFFGGFLLLMYGPTIVMSLLSFQDSRGLTSFPASGLFSSYWYDILVNDETQAALRDSIMVSLKLSALVCVITAVLSLMLGMAFRERFRGSTPLFYLVLLSLMTPGLLLSLGSTLLTSYIGRDASIYTTALGVQVVWALPFGFLVMLTVFNRYDARAEEAARDLGASAIRTFREVTLPIVWVGVFGAALFGFTLAWNEFERTYLVTGPVATLPTQLYTVMTATVFQPYIFALGVLTTLFSFVLIAHLPARQRRRRAARAGEGGRGRHRRGLLDVGDAGRRAGPERRLARRECAEHVALGHDVGVLVPHVEERGAVRRARAVRHGLDRHDHAVAERHPVDDRRPHAARRRRAADDHGVDAERAKALVQVGAEERRGRCFSNTTSPRLRRHERVDVAAVGPAHAGHEAGALDAERAGVREIRLVRAVRVGDGRAERAGGRAMRAVERSAASG